jgi:hypothetical protein
MDEANHTPRPENNSHSDLRSHATANLSIQSAMEVVSADHYGQALNEADDSKGRIAAKTSFAVSCQVRGR